VPIEYFAILKSAAPKALAYAKLVVTNWWSKSQARKEALEGKNLSTRGTLDHLVKEQLKDLASSSKLPLELQGQSFKTWLQSDEALHLFAGALVVQAGGDPEAARGAYEQLARQYEQTMGEAKQLAAGPIAMVVSDLYGQLTATEAARAKYDAAITRRIAAQTEVQRHPALRPFPGASDLNRLRALGDALLKAGRTTWKMPEFVAPLTLEAYEEREKDGGERESRSVKQAELLDALAAGASVVLYGDGGIGKTTFMLEVATSISKGNGARTVLFVDAALWAQSSLAILDYIAATPAARLHSVTADELANFSHGGQVLLAINGWNETPADKKLSCRESLLQLTSAMPDMSVVVTSRTSQDAPGLANARRVAVRGLTWQGQVDVIRAELPAIAGALAETLARNTRLRHAARSPLILRGLVERARAGADPTADSVYDLLGAVVSTFEADEKRVITLGRAPVLGMQERYLEELASAMNLRRATNLKQNDALAVIGTVAATLVQERLVGAAAPHPSEVLEVLASHHLLHLQDNSVRFAHQRFQEYFSAGLLLHMLRQADEPGALLAQAVNEPAWSDSLELVAGKLKQEAAPSTARVHLVAAAQTLDLSYACELAGASSFSSADDPALRDRLVASVNRLSGSPEVRVQELAIACQIASRLPAFADSLWALIESDDQQTRLHSHRLNGTRLALSQLGPDAETRMKTWPAERRSEFIHEVAPNADNYDFVARTAMTEADPSVRAAAIAALFWHYPASEAGSAAWLNAPLEVQTAHGLMNHLDYSVEQGNQRDTVCAQLKSIAASDAQPEVRLSLALSFPKVVGAESMDVVLEQLRTNEQHGDPKPLLSLARGHAPQRLRDLAIELAGGTTGMPDWAGELLRGEPADVHATAFERAWDALFAEPSQRPFAKMIGPLSSPTQTRRSVDMWLACRADKGVQLAQQSQRDRYYEVGYLLAHAPGDDLFAIIMELAANTSYEICAELLDLLRVRVSNNDDSRERDNPWQPTPEQFEALFDLTSGMKETAQVPSDDVYAYLACIASYVAPAQYGRLLVDAFRRQLDALSTHRKATATWMKNPVGSRPMNPGNSGLVVNALSRWGLDALPELIALAAHESASVLIPQAVIRITTRPWMDIDKSLFWRGARRDIKEGEARRRAGRVLLQPSSEFQPSTDVAAIAVANMLNKEIDSQLSERDVNPNWNARRAEFSVGSLAVSLSSIPSPEVLAPTIRALSSGLLEHYKFVDALMNLVMQGWKLSEPSVVEQLDLLLARASTPKWVDESKRHVISNLCQFSILVEPPCLLKMPISHYVTEWRSFAHVSDVIEGIASLRTTEAWSTLIVLCKEVAATGKLPDDIVYTLAAAMTPESFPEFARLVADGTLFAWCRNIWHLERIAPTVAAVVSTSPEFRALLVESWRKAASPFADALLGEVLPAIGANDEEQARLGLEAFDANRGGTNSPAYRILRNLFSYKTPLGPNQYEVNAKASNPLRIELYRRARDEGNAAPSARWLLASLELSRRENERPNDEPRHPEMTDGRRWTDALAGTSL